MKRILSLGAGVQSSTVLLMSCVGDLPKLDAAIFADTQWEPAAVYTHLAWLEQEAANNNIPVYRVSKGNIKADALRSSVRGYVTEDGGRAASLPYYTRTIGQEKEGMLRRQCTNEYKIQPIHKKLRELAGYPPRQVIPTGAVELWFGISREEMRRARLSQVRWIVHRYPLLFDVPLTRQMCLRWLHEHGFPEPPRSACIGCPFHSDAEWRRMRDQQPAEFAEACAFDAAVRDHEKMRESVFLHRSCQPLAEVDLSTLEERGQGLLWSSEECTGYCGA
jgi:hypothetical protein